ncbi:MAG TPA: STAS domain-containing protein [Sphingobium sp.]
MTILLDGSVTVRTIDALRTSIIAAFGQDMIVDIDASAVAEVDLSLVQLIESARAYAAQENKTIRLTAPANDALVGLLRRAGSLSEPTAEDIAFWCHGELAQ